jgi:magnesium-transporting ATPase (P-type)
MSNYQSVVQELQKSGHQIAMITGDSVWTAAEVARQVGIIRKGKSLFPTCFHLQPLSSDKKISLSDDPVGNFCFVPMVAESAEDENVEQLLPISGSNLKNLKKMVDDREATFCISGDTLQQLVLSIVNTDVSATEFPLSLKNEDKHALFHPAAQAFLKDLVSLVSVFARHSPRQKEAIIAAFNLGGFKTLMCGDGTNDMGMYLATSMKLTLCYCVTYTLFLLILQPPCVVPMLAYL